MKQLTSEIFIGQPIEVDFACVDYDGLLHFGKAINPRYTWASERWRGFDKIGEPVQDSGYEPLTSLRRGEQPQVIASKGSHERDLVRESFLRTNEFVPNEFQINERAEQVYIITDEDFESECGGEFDDYVNRKKRSRKAFVDGALWMRKILLTK